MSNVSAEREHKVEKKEHEATYSGIGGMEHSQEKITRKQHVAL